MLILLSCGNTSNKKVIPNFEENKLSFLHLRNGYDKSNNWIKKPENILMIHETLKKIGYKNLIHEELWTSEWNTYLDVSKKPKDLIDSLEITFENQESSPKYYREFWTRRKKEGNDKIVYQVVAEIKKEMIDSITVNLKSEIANDTLFNLLAFEYPPRKLTDKEANKLLEYLIKIGLHESAYNLVSGENIEFEDVNWNSEIEDVLKELTETEISNSFSPWFQDDVK